MKKIFDNHIQQELELPSTAKIVLAVSGGAVSVVMLDLFSKTGYACCIAHCNFHLRGLESDGDEKLVENLAAKYHFPYYKIDFDTKAYADENGISIEMAARDLRYNWFEEIRQKHEYKYIATAHHQDDVIETFLINLLRGTGIRGLSGIKAKTGTIIRPMLFTNRLSIMNYIKEEKLEYREDSSNSDIQIIRNKLRHQIIPLFNEINPAAKENIIKSIENLQYSEYLVHKEIEKAITVLRINDGGNIKINIEKLLGFKPVKAYIFEILRPYGFNSAQINDIENSLESISGKTFFSKTHQILKDRDELIISLTQHSKLFQIGIFDSDENINMPDGKNLAVQKLEKTKDFIIPKELDFVALDMDKLKFPLLIRGWETGDSFYPLGMKQKKKLSDYFIDEKISLIDKQKILLLISDNQIVWLIGKRIDNRFKITEQTKNILLLKIGLAIN